MASNYRYKHIVVVHGIGNQMPNETALGFMNEFVRALPRGAGWRLNVDNLIQTVDCLMDAKPDAIRGKKDHPRAFQPANIVLTQEADENGDRNVTVIGFSEVYWQSIARYRLKQNDGHLPIPIPTWAHSISTRMLGPGYQLAGWRAAIDNLEKMLGLLDKLAVLLRRGPEFVKVGRDFLGDVEMYAESDEIRQQINGKFFEVLFQIETFAERTQKTILAGVGRGDPAFKDFKGFTGFGETKTYVVAHSEGTVVAYNSLVQAAMVQEGEKEHRGDPEFDRAKAAYSDAWKAAGGDQSDPTFAWLGRVAGLVTLGSPLDKHYLIWRTRFRRDRLKNSHNPKIPKIPWFNFYDYNDPVAYEIKELKHEEGEAETDADRMFKIDGNDLGFQRYPIPGKAHVDYWKDRAIHKKIIHDLMKLAPGKADPVRNRWWAPLEPALMWIAYVAVRAATIGAGLFFVSQLLHFRPLKFLASWGAMQCAHQYISSHPFSGSGWMLNSAVWIFAPVVGMKVFFEAEQGLVKNFELWPLVRRILLLLWLAVAIVICTFLTFTRGAGVSNLVGYVVGLSATVLVWKLHTTVHRGLVQLWRYTRDL